jgi:four helix bundle protein
VDQIKRAVVSISNNIAEGAERKSNPVFARFLDIAKGSCGEVRSMLFLAIRLKYISSESAQPLIEKSLSVSRQLGAFSKFLRNSS